MKREMTNLLVVTVVVVVAIKYLQNESFEEKALYFISHSKLHYHMIISFKCSRYENKKLIANKHLLIFTRDTVTYLYCLCSLMSLTI